MDFVKPWPKTIGRGRIEIQPKFFVRNSDDLMIRGKDFYAFWDEEREEWSKDLDRLYRAIDRMLDDYYEEHKNDFNDSVSIAHMWDSDSGSVDKWIKYSTKQMHDNFKMLDDSIVFLNDEKNKKLYSSHRLNYALEECPTPCYDKLMSTLYSEEDRLKLEWAIGSIVTGDSKKIQKFIVIDGIPGSGKSTVLLIIQKLFAGYTAKIDSGKIGSGKDFAFETISENPLVCFEDEAKLDKLQENTGLNSLVAHEPTTVNIKHKSQYATRFHCMIFLCSNNPVNITDSKSGLLRRLIDVEPTGNILDVDEYDRCMDGIDFELGGIAWHCREVYLKNKRIFDKYIPIRMMRSTNVVYSWMEENYEKFIEEDGISLSRAWSSYKAFCEECDIKYRLNRIQLSNELLGYFDEYIPDGYLDDGTRVRSYFSGFKKKRFKNSVKTPPKKDKESWLKLDKTESLFDKEYADCPAQYATVDDVGRPLMAWDDNTLYLRDLKTSRLHYVRCPDNLIVIDFDIKNEKGEKDYILNLEAASKWPETYAELSRSGGGIHLHYIYNGNINMLSSVFSPGIEVKVYTGKQAIRRQLTFCNDIPIATISSGLPLRKEEKKVVDMMSFRSQRHLISFIVKQLRKETHADTHSSVSFIKKGLDDAYASGMPYCIPEDLREAVRIFAEKSTNHAQDCLRMWNEMKWESEEGDPADEIEESPDKPIAFFDIEVYPNLLLVCWKEPGQACRWAVNPEPSAIEFLFANYRLIGFNNRKYDNHILYARFMGYSIYDCYILSSEIVSGKKKDSEKTCFFREAYNKSYADVYDYSTKKQSLKKWEIDLKIPHKEMDLDWNSDVSEDDIPRIIEYCCNDVEATEAVFNKTQNDFKAREILADWAGMTVNTPTNTLTARIIFGKDKNTSDSFIWRDLSKPVKGWSNEAHRKFLQEECGRFTKPFDEKSVLPYFKGYTFADGTSTYRGFEVGEGGFVYAEPGMYVNVALIDVESMHPNSYIDELYSGVAYTRKFKQILDLRLCIKHGEFEVARNMFDGKLAKYLDDESGADALSYALKIAINSVYGLTSAKFKNAFYNEDNIDNIVAKRGALFMIDLLYSVQEAGFTVAHIKTDSIKIPNATPEIIQMVMDIGHKYGYNFEHEATYEKMCLVNNAVYIAKYLDAETCNEMYGYIPSKNKKKSGQWTATGTQFQVPYVFKTLFTHEPIIFDDLCETKSVTTSIYLDMDPDGEHNYKFVGRVGQFTPVTNGGGILVRKAADRYNSVTGTKGYRWLESDDAINLDPSMIDHSYYISMVDTAKDAISKYGDFDWFVA